MKILHTADIHLKEKDDQRWQALKAIVELGNQEKIDYLLIAGDLFDQEINAHNLRGKVRQIFDQGRFTTAIIPGNHDQETVNSSYYFGKKVQILDKSKPVIEDEELRIVGLDYQDLNQTQFLVELEELHHKFFQPDKANILLYHGELLDFTFNRGDFGAEGQSRYMPSKLDFFANLNISYLLAGHFHTNFRMQKFDQNGYFVYSGSPVPVTTREIGPRKVNLFELGQPPQEKILTLPYYHQLDVRLDPFTQQNPLQEIKKAIKDLPKYAQILLNLSGFIDGSKIDMTEGQFFETAQNLILEKNQNSQILSQSDVKDISLVLNDDLFNSFKQKIDQKDLSVEQKEDVIKDVIRAMIEFKS